MIYLASPYTHANPLVMERRFHCAAQATAFLMKDGATIFCPIVHCHYLACHFDMPKDFDYWKEYNLKMLALAERLLVLTMDGWKESKGVSAEITFASENSIPTEFRYIREFFVG